MSLQKNFPKDRKYYFWAIFLSHMIAIDDASSETDRKLFGTLAYRMISKAAADVPESVSLSPNIDFQDVTGYITDFSPHTVTIVEPSPSYPDIRGTVPAHQDLRSSRTERRSCENPG
jgi:hypothetical protein